MSSEAINIAKLATGLHRRLHELYKECAPGDDISAEVLEEILRAFEKVDELTLERAKRELMTNRGPG